jgi:hypothetical protein
MRGREFIIFLSSVVAARGARAANKASNIGFLGANVFG